MTNLAYYLGPWQWATEDDLSFWRAPTGMRGHVDLRSLPTQGQAGTLGDRPYGFFAVDPLTVLGSEYTLLAIGDCRELAVDLTILDQWQALIGYRPAGEKLIDLLWDQLTNGSDPTGDTSVMPLMPGVDLTLRLYLGGHSQVKSARFNVLADTPHADRVRTLLQRQYRASVERLGEHAFRVLDFACEKFRLDKADRGQWERLVPPDLRRDARLLPHETTITDDFNRANSSTSPGSSSEGWAWTEVVEGGGISGNKCYATAAGGSCRAESALSSDDHYAQFGAIDAADSGPGPWVRYHASEQTGYHLRRLDATTLTLFKCVAGAFTTLATPAESTAVPHALKIEVDGSSLQPYVAGAAVGSAVTDTAITGHLLTGWRSQNFGTGRTVDNFEAADLAVAAAAPPTLMLMGVGS